jgi:hypothetical protein
MATEPDLYVGKEPATFEFEGSQVFIGPGVVVRAGHPLMKDREALFEPLRVHYDLVKPAAVDPDTALRAQAEELGVKVDGRWSPDRLRQEIAKATQ